MKYLMMLWAAIVAAYFAAADRLIAALDRLPGFPNFLSVDYALGGFEKTLARLRAAQAVATQRADRFSDLAEMYDDMSDAAEKEADRAAKIIGRLNRLLD